MSGWRVLYRNILPCFLQRQTMKAFKIYVKLYFKLFFLYTQVDAASVDLFGLLSAYDWCVLDSRRYAALSLSRVYLHNSNNRNKCWLFPVRFRFSIRKTIHLNSVLLQKYQFYLKKMTLMSKHEDIDDSN